MAGYDGFSMSNNAVAAYDCGLCPASKIKGIPTKLIDEYCRFEEWHHSSKYFIKVKFYDPTKVLATFGLAQHDDYEADARAVAALAAHKAEARNGGTVHLNCTVEWLEWSGSRSHPRADECRATGCTVTVKGQTASVKFSDGRTMIKRVLTRGFNFKSEG